MKYIEGSLTLDYIQLFYSARLQLLTAGHQVIHLLYIVQSTSVTLNVLVVRTALHNTLHSLHCPTNVRNLQFTKHIIWFHPY